MMTENLLTPPEVSAQYRIPLATLRYWRHVGQGPASFRLGRRVLYRESDVVSWASQQYEATKAGTP